MLVETLLRVLGTWAEWATWSALILFPGSLTKMLRSTILVPQRESGWALSFMEICSPGTAELSENPRDAWHAQVGTRAVYLLANLLGVSATKHTLTL